MFCRAKVSGPNTYIQIVENHRDGKKVLMDGGAMTGITVARAHDPEPLTLEIKEVVLPRPGEDGEEPLPALSDMLEGAVRDRTWNAGVRCAALDVLIAYHAQGCCGAEALTKVLGEIDEGSLDDPHDELLGLLLRTLYPAVLSIGEVQGYLREPKLVDRSGEYADFWTHHVPKASTPDQLAELLDGIAKFAMEAQRREAAARDPPRERVLLGARLALAAMGRGRALAALEAQPCLAALRGPAVVAFKVALAPELDVLIAHRVVLLAGGWESRRRTPRPVLHRRDAWRRPLSPCTCGRGTSRSRCPPRAASRRGS